MRTVNSTWDAAGRRLSLEGWDWGVRYTWLTTGEMQEMRDWSNGTMVSFGYDQAGRRTTSNAFGNVATRSHDNVSRLAGLVLDLPSTANDVTFGYSHNPAGEIVSNTRSNDAYAYTAHANANVTNAVNGLNQLTSTGGASVSHGDGRGNVTAIGSSTYGYDSENRLVSAPGATLTYDPLGRLYSVSDGTNTRRFLYDGVSLVGEYAANGTVLTFYGHGPGVDEPLIWYDFVGSQFGTLHGDERGSVVAAVGLSTSPSLNRYDEYGNAQGSLAGRFGYTGQAWIPEAGLYHYRARAYNPAMGRFMQTDPIGFGGGMNLYAYVGNNPVNRVDPLGLCSFTNWAHMVQKWNPEEGSYGPPTVSYYFVTQDSPCEGGAQGDGDTGGLSGHESGHMENDENHVIVTGIPQQPLVGFEPPRAQDLFRLTSGQRGPRQPRSDPRRRRPRIPTIFGEVPLPTPEEACEMARRDLQWVQSWGTISGSGLAAWAARVGLATVGEGLAIGTIALNAYAQLMVDISCPSGSR